MGTSCIILDIRPGSQSLFSPPCCLIRCLSPHTCCSRPLAPHRAPSGAPGGSARAATARGHFPSFPLPQLFSPSPPPHRSRGRDSLPSRPFPPLPEGAPSRGSDQGSAIRALRSGRRALPSRGRPEGRAAMSGRLRAPPGGDARGSAAC